MARRHAGFVETSLYKRFPRQAWMQYDLFATKVTSQVLLCLPAPRAMHGWELATTLQGGNNREVPAMQVPGLGVVRLSPFRLVWRSVTVVIVTVSGDPCQTSLHALSGIACVLALA